MINNRSVRETFRILHLEDSPEDAELISAQLKNGKSDFELCLTADRVSFIEKLNIFNPDIILSDFNIPGFDGYDALHIAMERAPEIPFIFVTGAVGEEMAISALKLGAVDFILKKNTSRLLPAIERALEEKKRELERKKFYRALLRSEERYRTLMENLPVSVFRITCEEPVKIVNANISAAVMHGYETVAQLLQSHPDNLYRNPNDRKELFSDIISEKKIKNRLVKFRKHSGESFWGSLSAICHYDEHSRPNWIDFTVEDVSDRISTEKKLGEYINFFETLIDTISSPVFYKDISGRFLGCNRVFSDMIIGLPRVEIIGKTLFDLEDVIPRIDAEKYSERDNELFLNPGLQEYNTRVKCKDGKYRHFQISKTTYSNTDGKPAGFVAIMTDISSMVDQENVLKKINKEFEVLLASLPSIVIGVSTKDRITHWNKFAESVFNIKKEHITGMRFYESNIRWDWEVIYESIGECVLNDKSIRIDDLKFVNSEEKTRILGLTINALKSADDILEGFMILGKDVTEQKIVERQLLQTSKLEAIGQLSAGVAHEINTPLQYVGDNLKFINKSFAGITGILDLYEKGFPPSDNKGSSNGSSEKIAEVRKNVRLPFLLEEIPKALEQALEGVSRVSKIVQSMKAFSHPGSGVKIPTNINRAIENTATISRNEWKYDSELILELDKDLPEVPCLESEFNQVMLNLIVNSADAVHAARESGKIENGIIKIRTSKDDMYLVISVEDNGTGIPPDIRDKIFDPFFTTKDVGKGTGQGLPISHSIIVEKHDGILYFETEQDKGTTFIIKLPLE